MTNNTELQALQAEIATLKAQQELDALKADKATIENPIQPGQAVVLTRGTATGFEQGMAALGGLLTAGPLGAIAAWGALRGLQGKWLPWFILGVPAAPVLLGAQLVVGGALLSNADFTPSEEAPTPVEFVVEQGTEQSMGSFLNNNEGNFGTAPTADVRFQMEVGGPLVDCNTCTVTSRTNANGHKVYDVVESNGYTRSVVLWNDGSVEVFSHAEGEAATRHVGTWTQDGSHALVNVGGSFSFAL